MLNFFVFLSVVVLGTNAAVAPFLKSCKATDQTCVLTSAQIALPLVAGGIPDLHVPSLDPLFLDSVKLKYKDVNIELSDIYVSGLRRCSVESYKIALEEGKHKAKVRCSVELEGDYTMRGYRFFMTISEEGTYTAKMRNVIINVDFDVTRQIGGDDKLHWRITDWSQTIEMHSDPIYNFRGIENIFVEMSIEDIGKKKSVVSPVVQAIATRVKETVDALFAAVPIDELSIT